jgi:hypothetical protein
MPENMPPQLISAAGIIMIAVIMIVLITVAMIRVKPKSNLRGQSE